MKTWYAFSMVLLCWMGIPSLHPFSVSIAKYTGMGDALSQAFNGGLNALSEREEPPLQVVSGQLKKVGTDALVLVRADENIQTIFALQDVQGSIPEFPLQSLNLSSNTDGVSVQLSGGSSYCIGVAGAFPRNTACNQKLEGMGFAQIQFTKPVAYEHLTTLLNFYQSLEATLRHINQESIAGMAIPPNTDDKNKSCMECGAGGLGAKGCSIESDTFSCSVSCNAPYYACCTILGGCRCCK